MTYVRTKIHHFFDVVISIKSSTIEPEILCYFKWNIWGIMALNSAFPGVDYAPKNMF